MSTSTQHMSSWNQWTRERDRNQQWLNDRLYDKDYPALFLGDEMNTFHFDWDEAIADGRIDATWRVALMSMKASWSSLGAPALTLFYEQLHDYDLSWVIERSVCPPTKHTLELMKSDGISPFAVESKMPLTAFDVLCLSMETLSDAVTIPWTIMESGIPLHALDRNDTDPFVIMGGAGLVNPALFGKFCDILFFGEGEDALPPLIALLERGRREGRSREEILLEAIQTWDCMYASRFYENRYDTDGRFVGTFPLREDVPKRIHFCRVDNMDEVFIPLKPYVNFTDPGDTSHLEISRGCEGKCLFCMPGHTTLPFRPRDAKIVEEHFDSIRRETGNTMLIPVAFSVVSHPQINQIISDISSVVGDKIRPVSQRVDGFIENRELCCFMSMQKRGRIIFGVEGASQRLRDFVSKNLTEEQILELMPVICRNGYRIVKFMMICGLPGETEADLDELYELAVKIRQIFERETAPGNTIPCLLITWMVLRACPHTPLQWAQCPQEVLPAYATFTKRIMELGFRTYTPQITANDTVEQLLIRADDRLADLLEHLAAEGHLEYHVRFMRDFQNTDDTLHETVRFLVERGLPPLEEWLRERRWEDPLPWDIVEGPASKAYMYQRFLNSKKAQPPNVPVCSRKCSGCGACNVEQQEVLKSLPQRRERDVKIDLHHPIRKVAPKPVQHVLLEFEYDPLHASVSPLYWDCEIRRAFFQAGISFDDDSVLCLGSGGFGDHVAVGPSITNVSLGERYDLDELRRRIEEHAINFHVRSITELDVPVRVRATTYSMPLPEGVDMAALPQLIARKLAEPAWHVDPPKRGTTYRLIPNIRPCVASLEVHDGNLLVTTKEPYSYPREVYRYLFDIPADQTLRLMPERVEFTFEKKGVLDLAMTREVRNAFIRHRQQKAHSTNRELEDMAAYVSSTLCVEDLKLLVRREYFMPPPRHFQVPKNFSGDVRDVYAWKGSVKYLFRLIAFTLRNYDNLYSDGLYSFRKSLTAQDFLRRLRDFDHPERYWVIKADISNYVGSIVPELIIPRLEELWGDDPAFFDLLKYLLLRRECINVDGEVVRWEPGGLGGIPLANHFMNVHLMELDEYFMPRAPLYCRYSDDIVIFARTREEAKEYQEYFYRVLEQKLLSTNAQKTRLIEPGGEVEVLGCTLRHGKIDVSDHAKNKLKRKIRMCAKRILKEKRLKGLSDEQAARQMIAYCDDLFFNSDNGRELTWARWIFPVITETSSLKEIDRYVQDAIRYVVCGSLSKKRYRVRYKDLKKLGYRSILHTYYHSDV